MNWSEPLYLVTMSESSLTHSLRMEGPCLSPQKGCFQHPRHIRAFFLSVLPGFHSSPSSTKLPGNPETPSSNLNFLCPVYVLLHRLPVRFRWVGTFVAPTKGQVSSWHEREGYSLLPQCPRSHGRWTAIDPRKQQRTR